MSTFLFVVPFQGLAVWAAVCLAFAVMQFVPKRVPPLYTVAKAIAAPVLAAVNLITPSLVPKAMHAILAFIWLLTARVAFYMGVAAYGWLPVLTP